MSFAASMAVWEWNSAGGGVSVGTSCFLEGYEEERGITWVGDFEEDVFHHVAAVRALELEFLAFEGYVVETPHRH